MERDVAGSRGKISVIVVATVALASLISLIAGSLRKFLFLLFQQLIQRSFHTVADQFLDLCRFVKHIGQGKKRDPLWEQPSGEDAWGGSCFDFGGQLAAHQSRRGNRSGACHRNAFGPHDGCVPPFHCGGADRGG